MAKGLKRLGEVLIARSGLSRLALRLLDPSAVVLTYHNVIPKNERMTGDPGVHLTQESFGIHLDTLAATHEIVPLVSLLAEGAENRGRRAAITFDDGYQGALTAGIEELAAREFPATFFISPGLLGSRGFWWDLLAPAGEGPLSHDLRKRGLNDLGGRQEQILAWARKEGVSFTDLPDHARPSDEGLLLEVAKTAGIWMASHTWTHPNLARIGQEDLAFELSQPIRWLEERELRQAPWLAYPYGLFREEAVSEVANHYDGAVAVDGGLAMRRGSNRGGAYRVPRVSMTGGVSREGLSLRLAGLVD